MLPGGTQSGTISLPVAISRYFEVALYLLVLSGFGTLASTGGLDVPTVLLVGAALLFRGYLIAKRRTLMIPERWTTVLTFLYVLFYLADYFVISGNFMNSTVHLVLFVMVVRLFSARRDRDHYFLAVIAFLMVLAAAALTVDSVFLLAFAAFMLMAVVTFVLMEMKQAGGAATVQSRESSEVLAYRYMGFSIAAASPVFVALILLGAAGIFFALPRMSAGYLSTYAASGEFSTGFSDTVQLGRIGRIQQSKSVVLHIQIDGDQGGGFDLKWRGVTLSLFDGKTWSNPHGKSIVARMADGSFMLRVPGTRGETKLPQAVRPIHYRILTEPIGSSVFFLAATPRVLEGNYSMVAMDGGGGVFDLDPQHPVGLYQATSVIPEPKAGELRAASTEYPPDIELNYLQLAPLDPRVSRLAQQVTAGENNNYDRAAALEKYLQTNFAYTLQLPGAVPADPIANFLFQRKRGHCEYFASAMAIMLRTLHIPARIVNGFRTGEFNDVSGQYLVRASNAHSWVEAYFPGYGWVSFDPTPGAPLEMQTGVSRVMLYLDAMASFWREWVVNYDTQHQTALGWQATRSARRFLDELRVWGRRNYAALLNAARQAQRTVADSPTGWNVGGVVAAGVLMLAVNLRLLWQTLQRRRVASHPEMDPQGAASIWYQRMIRTISRRGWHKSVTQTPSEFVFGIEDFAMRKRVAEFTLHYERARFGASAEDACRLPHLYEEIVGQIRR